MLIIHWLTDNYIEILGVVTSLVYLYFSVKQHIWLWPFGIISSALFIYIFFINRFYADMSLQGYYLLISIYGWFNWAKGKRDSESNKLPVTRISLRMVVILLIIFIILWISIAFLLIHLTNSEVPWGDAFTTAASIVATWMLARKILEHWIIWVVVDSVSAGLYLYKEMYPTVLLYFIFTVIAVFGYYKWKKDVQ
jgi:nicotinamide mononucleotide transporter